MLYKRTGLQTNQALQIAVCDSYISAFSLSISPTFYSQLLRQNPFAKKLQNPNCKHTKLHKKPSLKNLLIKYW
jgi:hypothetical protein